MRQVLLHVYGPIGIHSYGLCIAIGLLLFTWLIQKDRQFVAMKLTNIFSDILVLGILAALFGGRFLYILEEPDTFTHYLEWFAFWKEGFSVLGSILAIIFVIPWYLKKHAIPIIPFFDLTAIYAPLLQSVARIGCFFAGCCYGIPTTLPWGIIQTSPNIIASLYYTIHPTQLYSSALFFLFFMFTYFILRNIVNKLGQLSAIYLIFTSTERFIIDLWRADRIFPFNKIAFSSDQLVAFFIFIIALIWFLWISIRKK